MTYRRRRRSPSVQEVFHRTASAGCWMVLAIPTSSSAVLGGGGHGVGGTSSTHDDPPYNNIQKSTPLVAGTPGGVGSSYDPQRPPFSHPQQQQQQFESKATTLEQQDVVSSPFERQRQNGGVLLDVGFDSVQSDFPPRIRPRHHSLPSPTGYDGDPRVGGSISGASSSLDWGKEADDAKWRSRVETGPPWAGSDPYRRRPDSFEQTGTTGAEWDTIGPKPWSGTSSRAPMSRPLQTLYKLQQMLDDTDYFTGRRRPYPFPQEPSRIATDQSEPSQLPASAAGFLLGQAHNAPVDSRWANNQDRGQYNKQQPTRSFYDLPSTPGTTDETHDNGWGDDLPGIPLYNSHTKRQSDTDVDAIISRQESEHLHGGTDYPASLTAVGPPSSSTPSEFDTSNTYEYTDHPSARNQYHSQYHGTRQGRHIYSEHQYPYSFLPNPYVYPYHLPYYNADTQQQHWRQAPQLLVSPNTPWFSNSYYPCPPPGPLSSARGLPPDPDLTGMPPTGNTAHSIGISKSEPASSVQYPWTPSSAVRGAASLTTGGWSPIRPMGVTPAVSPMQRTLTDTSTRTLAEASSTITFASIHKASLLLSMVSLACYAAVSPRTLPLAEYNLKFYENLRLAATAAAGPAIMFMTVMDPRENDLNSVVHTFFTSFSLGYVLVFVMELVATTLVRLAVLFCFEPDVFALAPRVPMPIIPWVLRENRFRPRRITLFLADFATSCLACPFIEGYVKLQVLLWTTRLPRNFIWVKRVSPKSKRTRLVAQSNGSDVTNANQYVTHMLAASIGLKLCDTIRRILLYTKPHHENKGIYAAFRGLFPIQELCGTMTAIGLARRDLLGVRTSLFRLLLPAVVVHGMAGFRGMKPIFKWNSGTPWAEMQLSRWNVPDSSTLPQLIGNGLGKLTWLIILGRVLGYCIKNYYMVNRQAVKRTTTYAGNHAAFSAELTTTEMLKRSG